MSIVFVFQLCVILWLGAAEILDPSQYYSLKLLYETTGGNSWRWRTPVEEYGTTWDFSNRSSDPCESLWQGINCTKSGQSSGNTNRVVEIILEQFNLVGRLDEKIFVNLTSLTKLSFRTSSLSGKIPSSLQAMVGLSYLDLSRNSFTGSIPKEIGSLSRMYWLNLNVNALVGQIPSSISRLALLSLLAISYNYLTGEIPSWIGDLNALKSMDLRFNSLSCPLPPSMSRLAALTKISISYNYLIGSIP